MEINKIKYLKIKSVDKTYYYFMILRISSLFISNIVSFCDFFHLFPLIAKNLFILLTSSNN